MGKWSLSRKIWFVYGVLALAFAACTTATFFSLQETKDALAQVTEQSFPRYRAAVTFKDDQRAINGVAFEYLFSAEGGKRAALRKKFDENVDVFTEHIEAYRAEASPEGRALAESYRASFDVYLKAMREALALAAAGEARRAEEKIDAVRPDRDAMIKAVAQIAELNTNRVETASRLAKTELDRTIALGLIGTLVGVLTSMALAFAVMRALNRSISRIVAHLTESSDQVTSAATQIAAASEQLSQAATEQAASLEETAAAVEEMNSMVAKNTQNASAAAQTSATSRTAVTQGQTVVGRMVESMSSINRSSDRMNEVVRVIEQIEKKTKVINDIVNKTELLSFNASVEAARAGEHGKGFAVVAEEVGNLARVSGAAAEEIATLISSSLATVGTVVGETKQNVATGTSVTGECGTVFEKIVRDVGHVAGMADEIASASEEQARGIGEITKAMNQLDQMTQQNAATAEECASSAEALSEQAKTLGGAVADLVGTVYGSGPGAAPATVDAPPAAAVARAETARNAGGNVIRLKAPRRTSAPAVIAGASRPKRAASDVPAYDHAGFTDV